MSRGKTQFRPGYRILPVAPLGEDNILPRFHFQWPPQPIFASDELTPEEKAGMYADARAPVLPYLMQDNYSRHRVRSRIPTFILENQFLRAVFYPTLGGRMTSLYDKRRRRELLFDNPVIQLANFGVRNAWFSGGVEWNGPVVGHTAWTCSPVFFAVVKTRRGPLLRIYEFDRLYETVWQVDIFLPQDSDKLWMHVTIRNPNDHTIDYYWWTNVTVKLTPETRVLAPADYCLSHTGLAIAHAPFPYRNGTDYSYPRNIDHADSIFFRKPGNRRPWEATVDAHGHGLMYVSTETLSARKFWVWGNTRGGKHWMDHLSLSGKGDYIEIQGGLAPTQSQTRPLEARSRLGWTECICALDLDPREGHEPDYHGAVRATEQWLDQNLSRTEMAETDKFLRAQSDKPVTRVLHRGSAWGMLHEKRMGRRLTRALDFANNISEVERPWTELLTKGTYAEETLKRDPRSWCVSPGWVEALEFSLAARGATWLHHLHLGVARMEEGKFRKAREHFQRSLQLNENWLTLRNLALLDGRDGELVAARAMYLRAWKHSGGNRNLAIEICEFFLRVQMLDSLDSLLQNLPLAIRNHERIQLVEARVALERGNLKFVRKVLSRKFVNVREGEIGLTDIWYELQLREAQRRKGRPLTSAEKDAVVSKATPPRHLDFRIAADSRGGPSNEATSATSEAR